MRHTIVSYTVKPGREAENAALVRSVFDELHRARPAGFRYAVFQGADSRDFVHLYTDEGAAPGTLQALPAFQTFVHEAAERHEQPATFTEFEQIGTYRTFDDPDRPASADDPDRPASADEPAPSVAAAGSGGPAAG